LWKTEPVNLRWLLRMSRWARNPPASGRVKLVLGLIAALLLIAALEHFGVWPESLTARRMRP
jgi:hypothetical protein